MSDCRLRDSQIRALAVELALFELIEGFAVDALCRSWPSLKASNTNFDTAGFTIAILILVNEIGCFLDFSDQFSFSVARSKFEAKFLLLASTI